MSTKELIALFFVLFFALWFANISTDMYVRRKNEEEARKLAAIQPYGYF